MRRFGLLFALLVVAATWAAAAEVLTVATYNVRNYGLADRQTAEGFRPQYPKPEEEKAALRDAIRALNADVLVLQEMGPAPFLEELRGDLRDEGCDYPFSALAVAADEHRHIAILSRRRLAGVATLDLSFRYLGGTERIKRGVLRVTVASDAGDITLFGVHLKSRLTERPDDRESAIRRAAEATAVRDAVLSVFPRPDTARFIVLGDFNDGRNSKALRYVQRRGKTAISTLLPAVDSRGETWTYCYGREDAYTRVDHILVSPGLLSSVVGGTATILDIAAVGKASDHRPVVVKLSLGR